MVTEIKIGTPFDADGDLMEVKYEIIGSSSDGKDIVVKPLDANNIVATMKFVVSSPIDVITPKFFTLRVILSELS